MCVQYKCRGTVGKTDNCLRVNHTSLPNIGFIVSAPGWEGCFKVIFLIVSFSGISHTECYGYIKLLPLELHLESDV